MSKLILPKRGLIKPTRRSLITGAAALMAMPYIAKGQTLLKSGNTGGGAAQTVAFDAATAYTGSASPYTFTHTPVGVPSAAYILINAFAGSFTSGDYGGTAFSGITSQGTGTDGMWIFGCVSPPSGAQTVTLNFDSGSAFVAAALITVTGSSGTLFRASSASGNTGSGTALTVNGSNGAVGDLWIIQWDQDASGTFTLTDSSTSRVNTTNGGIRILVATATGASTFAGSLTSSAGNAWGGQLFSVPHA